jgi:MFS family permease
MRLPSFGALSERSFRNLWLARTASAIGDAIVPVALAFAVLDLAGPTELGIVSAAYFGARMVFVLIGGVWGDRLPRKLVMIGADAVRALTHGTVALGFATGSVRWWHLAISSAVFGAAAAFFGPASTGLVPQLVPAARLQEANALLTLSRSATDVFGPALAGLLVATIGYAVVFAVDAATFVVSGLFLLAMRVPHSLPVLERKSFLADAREGFTEVRRRRWLWAGFASFAVGNLAMAPYFVLGPLVMKEDFNGARDWGFVLTGGAIGGIAAAALALRWKPSRPLLVAFSVLLLFPLQMLALAVPLPLPAVVAGSALAIVGIVLANVFWQTVVQQEIPNEKLARVDAFDWAISLVFVPLGFVAAGPVAARVGTGPTLVLAAALFTATKLVPLLLHDVRAMRRRDEDEPSPLASTVAV